MRKSIFMCVLTLLLVGCDSLCEYDIIDRKTSPDNEVDSILVRGNCGATTSYVYRVYLAPKGTKETEFRSYVFKADRADGIEVAWLASKELLISYDTARISYYTNFWHSRELHNFDYLVSISESPKR